MTSTSNSKDELKQYLKDMNEVVLNIRNQLANMASKGDVTEIEMEEAIQERHIENLEVEMEHLVTEDEFHQLQEQVKQLQQQVEYLADELDED